MARNDKPAVNPPRDMPMDAAPDRKLGRRKALARLGLIAGAAYMAPTLGLLRSAKADSGSSDGPPWAGRSKPSKPSKPSR